MERNAVFIDQKTQSMLLISQFSTNWAADPNKISAGYICDKMSQNYAQRHEKWEHAKSGEI